MRNLNGTEYRLDQNLLTNTSVRETTKATRRHKYSIAQQKGNEERGSESELIIKRHLAKFKKILTLYIYPSIGSCCSHFCVCVSSSIRSTNSIQHYFISYYYAADAKADNECTANFQNSTFIRISCNVI
jgi:hypothetical protein